MNKSREKYKTRKIVLVGNAQKAVAVAAINNAPVDALHPIEVVIRELVKVRKQEQNDFYWSSILKDISEQVYSEGRTFDDEVWHFYFKKKYLPESYEEGYTLDGYSKWDYDIDGERVLVGSTKRLTVKGFARYVEQCEAFGASAGVMYQTYER